MEVGVRALRNETAKIVAAVEAGERVTLTVQGRPVADIVPHARRTPWLPGDWLADELNSGKAADPALKDELDEITGQTLDEL